MKTLILYRPNSEFARAAEDFVHEFSRRYPELKLEVQTIDGREGSAMVSFYDLTTQPAVLVLQNDGAVSMLWQGLPLPLLDELAGYARA